LVKKLHIDGYDINAIDVISGDSILIWAVENGENYDLVEFLLQNGADPNVSDESRFVEPFLHTYESLNLVKLIVEKYNGDVNGCYEGKSVLD
jgi:ankyrin repeat protein